MSTLGRLNNKLKKEADKDGVRNFEIRIKEGVNNDTLTKEEQQLLQKASILATWRESPLQQLVLENNESSVSDKSDVSPEISKT